MRKIISLGIASVLISVTIANAQTSFSPDCAAQDLRLVTSIEELGVTGTVPSDKLSAAYSSVLDARAVCRTGQVIQALRLYREVSLHFLEATAAPKK